MVEYNRAFFGLYENLFIVLKERLGEEKALELFSQVMERGLGQAYDAMGFQKGRPEDFARVIRERDESVGLRVQFPEVSGRRIVYRFLTDPFPRLKGQVDPAKLCGTYMDFKVSHLLGEGWGYRMSTHIWDGDPFTEFVIEKK